MCVRSPDGYPKTVFNLYIRESLKCSIGAEHLFYDESVDNPSQITLNDRLALYLLPCYQVKLTLLNTIFA